MSKIKAKYYVTDSYYKITTKHTSKREAMAEARDVAESMILAPAIVRYRGRVIARRGKKAGR